MEPGEHQLPGLLLALIDLGDLSGRKIQIPDLIFGNK